MEIPQREYWRKGVHFAGIFFIPVLFWHRWIFAVLVAVFLVAYLIVETQLKKERRIPLLTRLATQSKRESEEGKISQGAILLCLSSLLLPYLLGVWPAAVGLSQVFAADATATWAGIKWGEKKLPFSPKKTWVGSGVYFATAFLVALPFAPVWQAAVLALAGTLVEALPFRDIDNATIPLAVGLLTLALGPGGIG